jgi:hypothetical protein
MYRRGVIMLRFPSKLGNFQGAIPDLEEVIQRAPQNSNASGSIALTQKAHHRLARCLFELGNLTDAMKEMDTYRDITGGRQTEAATILRNRIIQATVARGGKVATELPSSSATNSRILRYEVQVTGHPVSIVKNDSVPILLCSMHPPELPTKIFLAELVKKHHDAIMQEKKWTCWNCPRKAVSLVHTPASYLHLEKPMVLDFSQPVCVNGGECDKEARKMMDEEMRSAAATRGRV